MCSPTKNYKLLAKLQQGDMIVPGSMNHDNCLIKLYHTTNTKQSEEHYIDSEKNYMV